jgi:thiol-disulfide isomerase/thioredoxin
MSEESAKSPLRDRIFNGVLILASVVLIVRMLEPKPITKLVGNEAPAFQSVTIAGTPIALEKMRGQHVVLDFWATWCPPCRRQMPVLQSMHDDSSLVDRLQILSINVDDVGPDRKQIVESYLRRNRLSLVTLLDDGKLSAKYDVSVLPSIVVIDPQGFVTHAGTGFHSRNKILEWINE